jgi:hypothetical protein
MARQISGDRLSALQHIGRTASDQQAEDNFETIDRGFYVAEIKFLESHLGHLQNDGTTVVGHPREEDDGRNFRNGVLGHGFSRMHL